MYSGKDRRPEESVRPVPDVPLLFRSAIDRYAVCAGSAPGLRSSGERVCGGSAMLRSLASLFVNLMWAILAGAGLLIGLVSLSSELDGTGSRWDVEAAGRASATHHHHQILSEKEHGDGIDIEKDNGHQKCWQWSWIGSGSGPWAGGKLVQGIFQGTGIFQRAMHGGSHP